MRTLPACLAATGFLFALAAGDSGVPPRPNCSDYPVSRNAKSAAIAAVRVPPGQVQSLFAPEVSKAYIVVEVAVYPEPGQKADVVSTDFTLHFGSGQVSHPVTPQDLAASLSRDKDHRVPEWADVHGTAGVTYSTTSDRVSGQPGPDGVARNYPVNGRTRGVGTYEGVSVSSPSDRTPSGSRSGADPDAVAATARDMALPEGRTARPVAGYLYFPLPSKAGKNASLELRYASHGTSVGLPLPVR